MKKFLKKSSVIAGVLIAYFFLFLAAIAGAAVSHLYLSNRKQVIENRASEMTVLPQTIAKAMRFSQLSRTYRIPILMYHYVEYVKDARDTIRKSLDITPNVFENQIRTLKEAKYTFITAGDVADVLDGKRELPDKPVVLTFDDGYRDFFTDVFPILKKYTVPATAYLISGFIGQPNYMFESQIREIVASGLVEIGAHTVHHISLKDKPEKEVAAEVSESKRMLEREFGTGVISFAYPYGAFDENAVQAVRNTGFRTAVSTIDGVSATRERRFFLYRIRPGGHEGENLLSYLEEKLKK